jgi:hypothetical protein
MTTSRARPSLASAKAAPLAAADLVGMIALRRPNTSQTQIELLARATAAVASELAKLSADQQQRFVSRKTAFRQVLSEVLDAPDRPAETAERIRLEPRGPAEVSQGAGAGEILALDEGRRRADAYAAETASSFESWTGPALGPVEAAAKLGVSRSTLHAWQGKGLVIGLLNGVRRTIFPLEQFVDGKPVAGIADVLTVITEPQAAWMWLKEPSPLLGGATPLARLKRGRLAEVIEAARATYDQ